MLEHGGRLLRAAHRYGIAPARWLDISTGISPRAYPVPPVPPRLWQRLPEDEDGLIDAARRFYGAPVLLPVAGSQAAIQALPRLRGPSRVGVIAPGYAEHAHAWRQAGHAVETLPAARLLAEAVRFDVVVLIHPNNPGGDTFTSAGLLDLHAGLAARGGWLVVDEAFMDATPGHSLCGETGRGGLVVLRSVGKFFGMAGARAGFVCASPAILDKLGEKLGPWALAGPSRWAVAQALRDVEWQASQRAWLRARSAELGEVLRRHRLTPTASSAYFHWRCDTRAAGLHDALCRRGILTRLFETPASLRFGLCADDGELARLDAALAELGR
ncbi:threonine-phosphate decarboxylase [Lysobacter pythonis]|uniref:threonine-phosphate decarboxylase n=1 Tax=Solilutibacter pythonis TaxID=2483112 RepID=A0A3M2I7A8_9GAMM|nr:threonine-phosphate decarboxylase CobD [Lysobacter pythonis]RMH94164.1 threonine-phosphate decarboxylase [Lysobacter pythonis]